MVAQLIHVVRHAHAGDRAAWSHDDDLRPLSDRGCVQAEHLASALASPRPAGVYSSPSLRCMATVLPLARTQGLPLATLDVLYEGSSATALLDRLVAEARSPLVACTHGDVLDELLAHLAGLGISLPALHAPKGSTWTLEATGSRISSVRYAPPP
ncbi:MAG TPA: phosphoglycerate mutase family protein [Candidatus Dormibacteraeota bacterium]|nr:phosphoglycerate mutase family protein [Candidatus Dormibacteraeota bacterium]